MLIDIQAHAKVLRQKKVVGILLVLIFFTDLVDIAPLGGAVFLSSSVIFLLGIINSDACDVGKCEYQNTFHRINGVRDRKGPAELFRQPFKDFK